MIVKLYINYAHVADIALAPESPLALLVQGLVDFENDERPSASARLFTRNDVDCSLQLSINKDAPPPIETEPPTP